MSEDDLQALTGMRALQFWQLVDLFSKSGAIKGRFRKTKLSLPAFTLMHRMKMHLNCSLRVLKQHFRVSIKTAADCLWRAWFHHYEKENVIPKMWSDPQTTEEMMDEQYERFRISDPYFSDLVDLFEDPSGANRKPVCLLIDSTKIPVTKSKDAYQQKSSYFKSSIYI